MLLTNFGGPSSADFGPFGANVSIDQIRNVVNQIPLQWLQEALDSVLTATLTITILNIIIQPGVPLYEQVAASLSFPDPLGQSWLNLTQLGFMLTQGQSSSSP